MVVYVRGRQERDRPTDILQISRLHFFTSYFLLTSWFSGIYHQDFMVPSCSLPFPFCSLRICFYWFGLWSLHLLTLLSLGCNTIHKHHKYSWPPSSLPAPSVLGATLTSPKTKGRVDDCVTTQLLQSFLSLLLIFPAPIYYWNSGCFSLLVTKLAKADTHSYDSFCLALLHVYPWEIGGNYIFIDQVTPIKVLKKLPTEGRILWIASIKWITAIFLLFWICRS